MQVDDNYIMPFGRNKGKALANCNPADLLWYLDNIPNLSEGLKKYIQDNKHILELEVISNKQKRRIENR